MGNDDCYDGNGMVTTMLSKNSHGSPMVESSGVFVTSCRIMLVANWVFRGSALWLLWTLWNSHGANHALGSSQRRR